MDEIGRRLRAAREARGITLEVAEDETKIRRKYIEALEAGQEAVLPGDAYTKGFLRTYGNYLGLDGTALVDEYKHRKEPPAEAEGPALAAGGRTMAPRPAPITEETRREERREALRRERAARRQEEPPARAERPAPQELAPAAEPAVRYTPRPRRPVRKESNGLRNAGLAALVVALIGAVAYLGWLIFSQTASPPQDPGPQQQQEPPPAPVSQQPETTPPPKLPDPPKVIMSQPNATDAIFVVPAKEIIVSMELKGGNVWVEWTIDGKTSSATLPNGTSKEFKGTDIRLRAGHMDGVTLVVNGQRFEALYKGGGPYNLTFKGQ